MGFAFLLRVAVSLVDQSLPLSPPEPEPGETIGVPWSRQSANLISAAQPANLWDFI